MLSTTQNEGLPSAFTSMSGLHLAHHSPPEPGPLKMAPSPILPSSGDTLPFPSSAIENAMARRPRVSSASGPLSQQTSSTADTSSEMSSHPNYSSPTTTTYRELTPRKTGGNDAHPGFLGSPPPEPDSFQQMNILVNDMIQKIQELRHIGIEKFHIPLPKICVIGDQSAGKSSLIEGISQIQVPRNSGCCTRCPLEINLSGGGDQWKCTVWLVRKYVYDSKIRHRPQKNSRPLGPWFQQQEPELIEFATIYNKNDVKYVLERAQLATLNPGVSPRAYITETEHPNTARSFQVKFSPNVVRLDISEPGLTNLSFFDLPGVINVAENEEESYLVDLVRNLVENYVKEKNCINLLAKPMTDDGANCSAEVIVRKLKAENRTVGVLTKPDRVQEGEYDQWHEMLQGKTFLLGHGYFVVKNNPNTNIAYEHARREEEEFFRRLPWSNFAEYRNRFGTRHLSQTLSNLLLDQILTSLPYIAEEIGAKLADTERQLSLYPDPPSRCDTAVLLVEQLAMFEHKLRAQFDGDSGSENSLQKQWNKLSKDLRKVMTASRATIFVTAREETELWPTPSKKVQRSASTFSSPATVIDISDTEPAPPKKEKKRALEDSGESPSHIKRPKIQAGYLTQYFMEFRKAAVQFTLEEIREIRQNAQCGGIPNLVNPKAIEIMNRKCIEHWKHPAREFLDVTGEILGALVFEQIDEVFGQYRETALCKKIREAIDDFLCEALRGLINIADDLYDMEHTMPFTMDEEALGRYKKSAWEALATARRQSRVRTFVESSEDFRKRAKLAGRGDSDGPENIASIKKAEMEKVTDEMLGPDPFESELEVMATVRGYYELASSRFVDNVCHNVHGKLFAKCRDHLTGHLKQELGVREAGASERIEQLMAEDPARIETREQLKRDKAKLVQAQDWVSSLVSMKSQGFNNSRPRFGQRHVRPHMDSNRSGVSIDELVHSGDTV